MMVTASARNRELVIFVWLLLFVGGYFDYAFSQATGQWPMCGHDERHTGQSEYNEKAFGELKWQYQTGGDIYSSPAIGSDGTVYVGSNDHYLYAINPDGTLKWRYQTGNWVCSSPAIGTDGTVFVGSRDNFLYAINPDGTLKWRYQTGYRVDSSPAIGSDGTVYVGSQDHYFYAINPDGILKWRYQTGSYIDSSPAIASSGTIYVGSNDDYLYAINPNGTLKWRFQTGDNVYSSPAIGFDWTVYVGSNDGYLYAINPDGRLKWRFQTGDSISSSPAIGSDGTVYVGRNYRGCLYAINPDGTFKWLYETGDWYISSPAVAADGMVCVGSDHNYLYAIRSDGTLKWRYRVTEHIYPSPAIGSDGTVYVGSDDNYLYAFHLVNKGVLKGRVKSMNTDQGFAADISVGNGSNAQIRSDGYFFLILNPGAYQVTISKTGFHSAILNDITVQAGNVTDLGQDILIPTLGPLNLTHDSLFPASIGLSYEDRVWVAGGTFPYIFSVAYGELPPGLSVDTVYGYITGTATEPGSYTFSVGVRDQQNAYSEREYTIVVTQPLTIATPDLMRTTKGQFYFQNLEITGGTLPYALSIAAGALPAGVSMTAEGRFTGTPTSTGSSFVRVEVEDASGRTSTKDLIIWVDEPVAVTNSNLDTAITGQEYNQILQAVGGYGGYTWSVYTGILPQGMSLSTDGLLSGTSQSASTTPLVIMAEDSVGRQAFKNLTLHVTAPLAFVTTTLPDGAKNEAYSERIRVSGGVGPYSFSYAGTLPSGLSLDTAAGIISGTPTAAMLNNIQITVRDSSRPTALETTDVLALRITSMLTITSSAVFPSARLNQAFSPIVLRAVSGISPYQWSLSSGTLPPGITLDASTGQLTGTPTTPGDYVFTITVTDSKSPASTATKEFIYHVSDTLIIGTNAVPDGGKGIFYNYTVPASGGRLPYAWRIKTGSLPAGLTLHSATGAISGTPTSGTTVQFTLEVTDGDTPAQTAQKTFAIIINDKLFITTNDIPTARLGMAYTADINAALGTLPYTYSLSEGVLPEGLALSGSTMTATISGTPTASGQAIFTIQATDAGLPMQTATKQFTIDTYSLIDITAASLPNAIKGANYDHAITVAGGLPPYTWSVVDGQLPAGLSLNQTTGQIIGSPSAAPGVSSEFTVQVADAGLPAAPVQKQFVIYVVDPMTIPTSEIQGALQSSDYTAAMEGHGGLSPLSWSISAGALPEGLSLNADTGTISGEAVVCGAFDFTLLLQDSSAIPLAVEKAFHLEVICSNDYAIAGTISGVGAVGVTVKLNGTATGETTTDNDGFYVFEHLQNGSYTVTPRKPAYGFTPGSADVQINNRDLVADFEVFKLLGDVNGDSRITVADAIIAAQIAVEISNESSLYMEADVNEDDKIGVEEAIYILQTLAGIRQ